MIQSNSISHTKNFIDTAQTITGIKSDTIFTVCTTLFVFGAGLVFNAIISWLKIRREQENYKKTVELLLTDLCDVCKKQYNLTTKTIENFSLLDKKLIEVKIHIYAPLQFLNKMDYSLFIKYYVRGCKKQIPLKAKAATKTFQIIGYCNNLELNYEESFKFFMENMKPLQEMYLKNMLALELFAKSVTALEVNDYDFKRQLIDIYNHWEKLHTNNEFRNSFTNLVSPLIRLLDKFQMEKISEELNKLVQECHFAYSEISHTENLIRRHFKSFAFENKKMHRELSIILKILGSKQK